MPADDPYRTLGLPRGASLDEVKRAYRRLVKEHHPDAAGEAALPRFLAIQAAYDRIAGPDASTRRVVGRGAADGARRPWEADADRAGATHRAYGGRARPRPGARQGPSARPRTPPRPGGPARPGGTDGARAETGPTSTSRGPRPSDDSTARRRKKATLGSTSYDDVDTDAFEPDWGGASWYGTTSGTYWTLNPKEYADPRKHGPEYQARARRAGHPRAEDDAEMPQPGARTDDDTTTATASTIGVDRSASEPSAPPPPTHTTASWWEATAGDPEVRADSAPWTPRASAPRASASAPPSRPADDGPDLSTDAVIASIRGWLDDDHPTGVARIGRAVIGWTPVALGAGWLAGEVSGCGRFAATCSPVVAPATWITQLALLLLLLLWPRLARIGAIGTIAILGTVFPASLLLFATADPAGVEWGRPILGGLIVLAWFVGLGFGLVREVRRGTRPVS